MRAHRVLVFLSLLLTGGASLFPVTAEAYVRSRVPGGEACLYWGTRDVFFEVNEKGSKEILDGSDIEAVIASFEVWNDPDCSDFAFVFAGLTDRTDVGYEDGALDNINLLVFRRELCSEAVASDDPCWRCFDHGGDCCPTMYNCWGHAPGAIAITTTTFHRSTGLLVDADIEMNEARHLFTSHDGPPCEDGVALRPCSSDSQCRPHEACMRGRCRTRGCVHTDIANTVAHEVGHVLGLDHTPVNEATMYASATIGETKKRELHEDDIQGLCDIYPASGPTLTCLGDVITITPLEPVDTTPNCLGCASGSSPPGRAILLVLALPILFMRPARRASPRAHR